MAEQSSGPSPPQPPSAKGADSVVLSAGAQQAIEAAAAAAAAAAGLPAATASPAPVPPPPPPPVAVAPPAAPSAPAVDAPPPASGEAQPPPPAIQPSAPVAPARLPQPVVQGQRARRIARKAVVHGAERTGAILGWLSICCAIMLLLLTAAWHLQFSPFVRPGAKPGDDRLMVLTLDGIRWAFVGLALILAQLKRTPPPSREPGGLAEWVAGPLAALFGLFLSLAFSTTAWFVWMSRLPDTDRVGDAVLCTLYMGLPWILIVLTAMQLAEPPPDFSAHGPRKAAPPAGKTRPGPAAGKAGPGGRPPVNRPANPRPGHRSNSPHPPAQRPPPRPR